MIDATYRVQSLISESDRAHVYVVSHVRFPEMPLVLKVSALERQADFDRNTAALATVTSPCVTRVVDRGRLPDGRPYRVVERLAGPTLRQALMTGSFTPSRAKEILVALAAAAHEAQANNLGPCDLSVDNLMFADGRAGKLSMMRVLVDDAKGPDLLADQLSLAALREELERGQSSASIITNPWKPPSNLAELRAALTEMGAPHTPESARPGAQIQHWQVIAKISETLRATVYEVRGSASGELGILKVAGPEADFSFFQRHADLLSRASSRHVVKILDMGAYEGTPFMVMDKLHLSQSQRLEYGGPISIDAALQTIDELLWGAEAINKLDGSPSDFSLEHCYQATRDPSPAVITHAMVQLRNFGLYGKPARGEHADAWSAAVALYELIAGHLPFPTKKHALAKVWMGMPTPLGVKRRDVPLEVSELVNAILTGTKMKTAELRRELTRIRSTPQAMRTSVPPPDPSVASRPAPIPKSPRVPRHEPHHEPRHEPEPRSAEPQPTPVISVLPAPHLGGEVALEQDKKFVNAPTAMLSASPKRNPTPLMANFADHGGHVAPVRRSIQPPEPVSPEEMVALRDLSSPQVESHAPPPWRFEVAETRCPLPLLVAAAFSRDGREVVAVSHDAVARYRRGHWTIDPARDTAPKVVALASMSDGGFLATTSSGPLLRLSSTGGFSAWGVGLGRYAFSVAVADGEHFVLAGHTTDAEPRGVIARLVGESMTILADDLALRPIRGATVLPDGTLLVVTEGGMIARLRGGEVLESIHPCEVDLFATCVAGGDVLVVGAGAWAFRVTVAPLMTHLESVETLSSLTCLTTDGTHAWVGSSKGRILRRHDQHWRRMSQAFDDDPPILALAASATRVRVVTGDGRIVLGQPIYDAG